MSLKKYLGLVSVAILLVGLPYAVLIYLTAEPGPADTTIYEFEHSKLYARNMKVYGGEMAVLADELGRWFRDLWRGRSLAYTVACITVIVSGGVFLSARRLPPK